MGSGHAGRPKADGGREDVPYRALFEWAPSGMAVASVDGRVLAANPALCCMLGFTEDELCQLDLLRLMHPEDRAENERLHRRLLTGSIPSFVVEQRYVRADHTVLWARVGVTLIRDAAGTPLYVTASLEDVTAHRLATDQLELSQSLLRVAGKKARIGGWAVEQPSQEVFWSDEMFELLDMPRGGEPSLTDGYALYPPRDRERVEAAVEACARDGVPFDLEVEVATFTGRMLWVRIVGEAERASDGSITRVAGAFQDISELRAARAKTEEVADRLTISLESMTDAVYLLDRDWRFTYLNPRAEQLLQHDRDELLGRNIWEAFPEAVDSPAYPAFTRAARDGVALTLEDLYYPPLDTWFANNVYPSSHGLAVYFHDVTERHEAQLALEQRERKLAEQAALLDETQAAIFVQDLDGIVTYWNRSAEQIYGWSSEEAIGCPAREIVAGDADVHEAAMRAVVSCGVWNRELTHVADDGRELVIAARWTLLRDAAGTPRSILVTDTDVTDGRRLQEQLIRSQRLESIGTLAGGIAHDLNNVLAPILLAIELLSVGETDPFKREILHTIEDSAQRGATMVRQVLSFARGVDGERVELDVTELVTDVLRIAAETFPRDIRLMTEFSSTDGRVSGDETQLHQVLMNLLVNARDALPVGGTVTCSTYNREIGARAAADAPGVEPGRYVILQVEDDGDGMRPEVADRIFEPFFTTKRHGQGTGLGLPTSLAIVESHGGHIQVQSNPGRGTIFRVYLPSSATHDVSNVSDPVTSPPRGTGQLILVVDDEAPIRAVMQQTLQGAGYRVLTAGDGAEAVAIYRMRRDDIALVITDLMMPVMSGSAAIEALRATDPRVRVIASSGLIEQPQDRDDPAAVEHVLTKPFTAEQLLRLTAAALDADV